MDEQKQRYLYREHMINGRTLDDLEAETGISRYRIHRLVRAYRWRIGEVVMTAPALKKLYIKDGLSTREIAEKYFCSDITVRRHLKKCRIKIRPQGNPKLLGTMSHCEK